MRRVFYETPRGEALLAKFAEKQRKTFVKNREAKILFPRILNLKSKINLTGVKLCGIIHKMINQFAVAKKAGVARSAVSMVLNNYPGTSKATRGKILMAMQELGYKPSRIARSLKNGVSLTLGVICFRPPSGTIYDFVFLDLLRGIQKAALEEGYTFSLFFPDEKIPAGKSLCTFLQHDLDGLILIERASLYPEVLQSTLPKVVINAPVENLPHVWADEGKGIYDATIHLLSLGHTRIGYIAGNLNEECFERRLSGYKKAVEEAGIGYKKRLVLADKTGMQRLSASSLQELLKPKERVTGVVCHNDVKAIEVMEALKGAGLSIPEDISVFGFDDMPLARESKPPLSTVYHPRIEVGYTGAKMLMDIINKKRGNCRINLKTNLVLRNSCGKINGGAMK